MSQRWVLSVLLDPHQNSLQCKPSASVLICSTAKDWRLSSSRREWPEWPPHESTRLRIHSTISASSWQWYRHSNHMPLSQKEFRNWCSFGMTGRRRPDWPTKNWIYWMDPEQLHLSQNGYGTWNVEKYESRTWDPFSNKSQASWWFHPIWTILVKLDHFPM